MKTKRHLRLLLVAPAILTIVLSLMGILGSWYAARAVTDITLKAFSVVETGAAIAETGVQRVHALVLDGRQEIAQTEQTLRDIGENMAQNSPALTALNNRLDRRLAPTVEKIDAAIAPVREGLVAIDAIVQFANDIPFVQENAPNLGEVEEVLQDLTLLNADIQQLNDTLDASVVEGKTQWTQELGNVLLGVTGRIDERLAAIQQNIETLLADIDQWRSAIQRYKSRLLFSYNLSAALSTLLFLWIMYSQVVIIRLEWTKFRGEKTSIVNAVEIARPAHDKDKRNADAQGELGAANAEQVKNERDKGREEHHSASLMADETLDEEIKREKDGDE